MQLGLNLVERLAYSADKFLVHSGVLDALEQSSSGYKLQRFILGFIVAEARAGKSHLAVKIANDYSAHDFIVHAVEGPEFTKFLQSPMITSDRRSLVIVDDSDHYFSNLDKLRSGEFVNFIESQRTQRGVIIFLSRKHYLSFNLDEHVSSRLRSGLALQIADPEAGELAEILELMARQRGLALTPHKIKYLVQRLGRDIASVESYLDRIIEMAKLEGKPIKFSLLSEGLPALPA